MSKNILFSILAILLMMTTACHKKDNCNDDCLNGRCVGDSCSCHPGFTGKYCDVYVPHASGVPSSPGPSSSSTSASGNGGSGFSFIFWRDFEGPPVHVTLWSNMRGAPVKDVTKHYPSAPVCGSDGCATFQIGVIRGGIVYSATDGIYTWQDTIGYQESCTNIKLEKP